MRIRVNRLSNFLTLGGAFTICLAMYAVVRGFLITGFTGNIFAFFGSIVTATMLVTFGSLVIVGAGSLSRFRSKGLGMTAAILAIVVAVPGLFGCGSAAIGITAGDIGALFACFLGGICVFQVPMSLWGGIGTLLIINGEEINQAFQQERERQLRVSQLSGEFVPEKATGSACFQAACWFVVLGLVLFILVGLFGGVFWRLSAIGRLQSEATIALIVGCVLYSLFVLGIILSAGALFMRAMPVLGYLGSVLCIFIAMQGLCGGLMSIPALVGITDAILRPIFIGIAVLLIGSLVLGVICALVGFSASNLLVRYRTALAKQTVSNDRNA